jgi:beta-lactamase class A
MSKERHQKAEVTSSGKSLRIDVKYVLVVALAAVAATFFLTKQAYSPVGTDSALRTLSHPEYQIRRLTNFKFIRPLFSAKPVEEYEGYYGIKNAVAALVQSFKDQGMLSSASVYVRDFDKSNWIVLNPDQRYNPGSILKIPILMTILRTAEDQPGYLDHKMPFAFKFPESELGEQAIKSKQIEFGKTYTLRELLKYMIEYSDNNAKSLLALAMDKDVFAQLFVELGMPKPDVKAANIPLTAQECSSFMETLFNATYLNIRQSEFAIDLLCKSTFDDGIVKGIPNDKLLIAHKFGESGTVRNRELHETGILYIDDRPYLITIMTRGNDNVDFPKLATVIQEISRTIYDGLTKKEQPSLQTPK